MTDDRVEIPLEIEDFQRLIVAHGSIMEHEGELTDKGIQNLVLYSRMSQNAHIFIFRPKLDEEVAQ